MKAVAVFPRQPNTMHLAELPAPQVGDVPNGRGVRVQVLRVGGCGTDKEINAGEYGAAPPGYDFLVIGHENFGRVLEVGPQVRGLRAGDYVVATVRRPGHSLYDLIGTYDMTTDDTYYERGINLLHGYCTEQYVDDPEFLVKVPPGLKDVGVLLEPCSVVEKGIAEAYETQRRLRIWRPQRAAVLGAGPVGLLATLALRLRGLEVVTLARSMPPTTQSRMVEALGAQYLSTKQTSLTAAVPTHGPFDLIFEATGYAPIAFEAMDVLGKDGVLILSSVTGGNQTAEVPADRINLGFVLGNKVMLGTVNANREYFELGVRDFALAEATYPGWLRGLLTNRVAGLDQWAEFLRQLTDDHDAIKVYLEVAPDSE
ncbi:MAG TPA: glucose 1-dehydrogenase [Chloroflexia bacterium]|nr:glucose 1-dehydrogenase [Chloroflexia bacterium]